MAAASPVAAQAVVERITPAEYLELREPAKTTRKRARPSRAGSGGRYVATCSVCGERLEGSYDKLVRHVNAEHGAGRLDFA